MHTMKTIFLSIIVGSFLFTAVSCERVSGGGLFASVGKDDSTRYAWKDKSGTIHITSEKPPEGAELIRVIKDEDRARAMMVETSTLSLPTPTPDMNPPALPTTLPTAAPTAVIDAAKPQVILLSTTWCIYCKKAREFLKKNDIPFTEYDTEKTAEGKELFIKHKGRGVPVIIIDDKPLFGFSEPHLKELLNIP